MNAQTETCQFADHESEDERLLELLQASVYPACDSYMLLQIVRYCRAASLDPMLRPVHVVPVRARDGGTDLAIVPGIGTYRAIAARCGCAGIDEPQFGPEITEQFGAHCVTYPSWCRVTVRRRLASGEVALFTAREFWRENAGFDADAGGGAIPNEMWRRRPFGQLAKCAEAQALRRAFPEVGAQPVLEELAGTVLEPAGALESGAPAGHASTRAAVAMPQSQERSGNSRQEPNGPTDRARVQSPAAGQQGAKDGGTVALWPPPRAADVASVQERLPLEPTQLGAGQTGKRADPVAAGPPKLNTAGPAAVSTGSDAGSARQAGERLITAGERACLERRLRAKGIDLAAARQLCGLAPGNSFDDLTRPQVQALMEATA